MKHGRADFSKHELKKIARQRILELRALSAMTDDRRLSRRYNEMLSLIALRMDITLERGIKRSFCKNCFTPYGKDSRIRLKRGLLELVCDFCGDVRRIPYKPNR
ncbi:MAG: ribonuclease P Rpr2/Rpp21/SNM1 subunit family protein [Thermoplasmataceae archaeon]